MGLLSFVGDAFNDIFGGNSSRKDAQRYNLQNMEIQQQYAERNMELQNQYNIEAFNRENEYNSPVAQKMRNYQAGINPNWQDGAGVVAQQESGVSASAPSGAMPTGSNIGGIGDIVGLVKLGKELKNIDADTTKKYQEGNAAVLGAEAAQQQADSSAEQAKAAVSNSQSVAARVPFENANDFFTSLLNIARTRTEHLNQDALEELNRAEIRKRLAEAGLSEAQMDMVTKTVIPTIAKIASEAQYNLARVATEKATQYATYQGVKQKWKELAIAADQVDVNRAQVAVNNMNAVTNRKQLQEFIRSNKFNNFMQLATYGTEQNLRNANAKYFEAGHKLMSTQNAYMEVETQFRRYCRANHLDAMTTEAFLTLMRNQSNLAEEQTWLTREETDNFQFRIFSSFLSALGIGVMMAPTPPGTTLGPPATSATKVKGFGQ